MIDRNDQTQPRDVARSEPAGGSPPFPPNGPDPHLTPVASQPSRTPEEKMRGLWHFTQNNFGRLLDERDRFKAHMRSLDFPEDVWHGLRGSVGMRENTWFIPEYGADGEVIGLISIEWEETRSVQGSRRGLVLFDGVQPGGPILLGGWLRQAIAWRAMSFSAATWTTPEPPIAIIAKLLKDRSVIVLASHTKWPATCYPSWDEAASIAGQLARAWDKAVPVSYVPAELQNDASRFLRGYWTPRWNMRLTCVVAEANGSGIMVPNDLGMTNERRFIESDRQKLMDEIWLTLRYVRPNDQPDAVREEVRP